MNRFVLVAAIAGSLVSGQAIAACTNATRLNAAAISLLLGGNTVCVPTVTPVAPLPMTWQEEHVGNSTSTTGALIDFKRGSNPVDPTKTVGTWTVTGTGVGNSTVTHNYGAGGSYTYTVHSIGGTIYGFCGAGPEIVARIKPGSGAC